MYERIVRILTHLRETATYSSTSFTFAKYDWISLNQSDSRDYFTQSYGIRSLYSIKRVIEVSIAGFGSELTRSLNPELHCFLILSSDFTTCVIMLSHFVFILCALFLFFVRVLLLSLSELSFPCRSRHRFILPATTVQKAFSPVVTPLRSLHFMRNAHALVSSVLVYF